MKGGPVKIKERLLLIHVLILFFSFCLLFFPSPSIDSLLISLLKPDNKNKRIGGGGREIMCRKETCVLCWLSFVYLHICFCPCCNSLVVVVVLVVGFSFLFLFPSSFCFCSSSSFHQNPRRSYSSLSSTSRRHVPNPTWTPPPTPQKYRRNHPDRRKKQWTRNMKKQVWKGKKRNAQFLIEFKL